MLSPRTGGRPRKPDGGATHGARPAASMVQWRDGVPLARRVVIADSLTSFTDSLVTLPCRQRDANPSPPATAGGGMCAGLAMCVCYVQRSQRASPKNATASSSPHGQPTNRKAAPAAREARSRQSRCAGLQLQPLLGLQPLRCRTARQAAPPRLQPMARSPHRGLCSRRFRAERVSTRAPNEASRAVGTHYGPTRIHGPTGAYAIGGTATLAQRCSIISARLPPALFLRDDCGPPGLLGMGTAAASAGAVGPSQGLRAGWSSGRTEAGVHRGERSMHLRERADDRDKEPDYLLRPMRHGPGVIND